MIRFILAALVWFASTAAAIAQDVVWIQVEAKSTLASAQDRARSFDADLDDVAGYSLGGRWYGIVLGPYLRDDATALLVDLKRARRIPADSFIALGNSFGQQFWPIGVGAPTTAQPLPTTTDPDTPVAEPETPAVETEAPTAEVTLIAVPDETPREARASEAQLSRQERKDLQVALQWAGFYSAAIDGAFGRGTRRSMRDWQEANKHEPTGILTTGQRLELRAAYDAVLDGVDMQLIRDDASGIEVLVPGGVVTFADYEPPFVRFEPKGDLDARVLLISQHGDQDRLFGLYEILQTLKIVPSEGPRSRSKSSFELEGIGDDIHSYTTARLKNGEIKGFTLIWPAGDDERRRRILQEMQDSFATFDGVLDPSLSKPDEDQAIDLISGLQVRKPRLSRSGFYIDTGGTVLTSSTAVDGCEKLTIDSEHDAQVVHIDDALGIAVLRPNAPLAPLDTAVFQTGTPRLQSEVAVAGFPYGGVLVTPSLTFGKLADLRGLNGEETIKRLTLTAQEGDAGGPVFDNGGAVLGMLLPRSDQNGQILPAEVSFSIDSDQIIGSLSEAGINVRVTDSIAFMPKGELTMRAADTAVLVSCW